MDSDTIIKIFVLLPGLSYLLGAIPFGLLIGLARGVDIRTQGSGNIGATNVGRVLGRGWGYGCFLLDVGKGLGPVLWAGHYLRAAGFGNEAGGLVTAGQWSLLAVAAGCILGHMFSVYLKFKGGKGVATSLGVLLGVWPWFTLTAVPALLVWVAVWGFSRIVSLASIVAAISFPLVFWLLIWRIPSWQFSELLPLFGFGCVMAALIVFRHRSNIARLLAGTENRGGKAAQVNDEFRNQNNETMTNNE
ncbi:MAG: glycerol-3-phosphate 1-O-acyltransferase PlsY [Sedimentisphaerales bacterium]|nr:glycerol-3-phosphate 1-O-acyltransferase PlsY [Sedimentisphaerales bacterium]